MKPGSSFSDVEGDRTIRGCCLLSIALLVPLGGLLFFVVGLFGSNLAWIVGGALVLWFSNWIKHDFAAVLQRMIAPKVEK